MPSVYGGVSRPLAASSFGPSPRADNEVGWQMFLAKLPAIIEASHEVAVTRTHDAEIGDHRNAWLLVTARVATRPLRLAVHRLEAAVAEDFDAAGGGQAENAVPSRRS